MGIRGIDNLKGETTMESEPQGQPVTDHQDPPTQPSAPEPSPTPAPDMTPPQPDTPVSEPTSDIAPDGDDPGDGDLPEELAPHAQEGDVVPDNVDQEG